MAHNIETWKILYMSGYPADVVSGRGLLKPGEQYLAKPFSPDSLLNEIRGMLGPPEPAN
jgi:DNA-binding response OmpR family regulator